MLRGTHGCRLGAGLAIVDADGVAALTMRRLGTELGVEAMALYDHVPNKATLQDRVASRVAAEIRFEPVPGDGWRAALERFGASLRATLIAHPRALPLLTTRSLDPEAGLRLVTQLLPIFAGAGFDEERGVLAVQCVAVYTIGHALAETSGDAAETDAASDGRGE